MNEQWETQLQQRLEQRLSGLHQDLERVWWKDGPQVRARGVRLTMNRVWLTLLVVVVVLVSLCVGTTLYERSIDYYPPPEPLPTAEQTTVEPSLSPGVSDSPGGSTAVPLAAMLMPNDVGADFTVEHESAAGPSAIRPVLSACTGSVEVAVTHWRGGRGRTLTGPGGASIEEEISAFEPTWAGPFMSEWRQRIASCPTYKTATTGTYLSTVDVPGLGQDAFLVRREVVGAGVTGYVAWSAFIRQGDLVVYVGENQGETFVREVAAKAAGRLCAAVC
jgi:hypothetical protein